MGTSLVDRWSEGELQPNWHNNIQQKQRKWVENVHTKHKPSLTAKIHVHNVSIVLLVIVYWDLMMLPDPKNHLAVGIVNQKFIMSSSFTDTRSRLSGMQIKGDGHLIYEDHSRKHCHLPFPPEGTDVCSNVIRIPFNATSVRILNISTDDYLTLCEVQVFGGIQFICSLTSDLFNTCSWYSPMFIVRLVLSKLLLSQIRFEPPSSPRFWKDIFPDKKYVLCINNIKYHYLATTFVNTVIISDRSVN